MLTDTTFWLDYADERRERRRGPAHAFIAAHRAHEFRVSVVTWEELAEGLERSAEVDLILQQVRLTLIPKQVAWETSRIQRELSTVGRRLGKNDAWLAGTARSWGMRLISNDRRFDDVPRLRAIHY